MVSLGLIHFRMYPTQATNLNKISLYGKVLAAVLQHITYLGIILSFQAFFLFLQKLLTKDYEN